MAGSTSIIKWDSITILQAQKNQTKYMKAKKNKNKKNMEKKKKKKKITLG